MSILSRITTRQKDPFIVVIDDLFTRDYSEDLIKKSEETNYSIATVTDKHIIRREFRNGLKNKITDADLANNIFETIRPYVPQVWCKGPERTVLRLNSDLSFLKYNPGEYFKGTLRFGVQVGRLQASKLYYFAIVPKRYGRRTNTFLR